LDGEQVVALLDACGNDRDAFIIDMLYATGVRLSELCGLRISDLHFLPSSKHLDCDVVGPHVEIHRRTDNANGALAKSWRSRAVPVPKDLVVKYTLYRAERDACPEAEASDFVFVNLYKPPLGHPLKPDNVDQLFVRLSKVVGFRVTPHTLRHTFGSNIMRITGDRTIVRDLMGHALMSSSEIYLHPKWDQMRDAVDHHADRVNNAREGF